MKKILVLFIAMLIVFAATGCGGKKQQDDIDLSGEKPEKAVVVDFWMYGDDVELGVYRKLVQEFNKKYELYSQELMNISYGYTKSRDDSLDIIQNVFTKLILKDGDKEVSKELKVKMMRIRMAYTKAKKKFDEETQEFITELVPQELRDLNNKIDKSEEELEKEKNLGMKVDSEYREFLIQKGNEDINLSVDDSLTIDEYSDILEVNAGNDVEINGNKISATDFMEIIYDLFVKE